MDSPLAASKYMLDVDSNDKQKCSSTFNVKKNNLPFLNSRHFRSHSDSEATLPKAILLHFPLSCLTTPNQSVPVLSRILFPFCQNDAFTRATPKTNQTRNNG